MASAAAVHKERAAKALSAMENIGLSRTTITPILKQLLKIYNNEWDFIEAENYRLLADQAFDQQEAQASKKNAPPGPLTRARRAQSAHSDLEEFDSPEDIPEDSPEDSPSSPPRAATRGGRARTSTPPARTPESLAKSSANGGLHPLHQPGLEYHSAAAVRSRAAAAAGQNGHPGQGGPGSLGYASRSSNSPAATAREREKGKSPLLAGGGGSGGQSRRLADCRRPESLPPRPREETRSPAKLVSVKIEVLDNTLPAPEGFEKVSFEKVDGVIVPAKKRLDVEALPLIKSVKLEENTPEQSKDGTSKEGTEMCFTVLSPPAPPPAPPPPPPSQQPPVKIRVKTEPQDVIVCIPDHHGDRSEEVLNPCPLDQNSDHFEALEQRVETGILALEGTPQESDQRQIILYGTTDIVMGSPSTDHPLSNTAGASSEQAPASVLEGNGGNALECLGDYASDEDLPEPPDAGVLALIPIEPTEQEQVEPSDIQLNGEGIRPNFILCQRVDRSGDLEESKPSASSSKRDLAEVEDVAHPKRQKCISDPPTTGGVKRHGLQGTRGQAVTNSALKRLKIEPCAQVFDAALASPLDQQARKARHDPADISRGTEKIPIPFVNDFTSETITSNFKYIPSNAVFQSAYINISLARIGDEDCCLTCSGDCLNEPHSCACTREMGGEFAYTKDGLLKPACIMYELDRSQNHELKLQSMTYCQTAWDCPIERAKNDLQPEACKGHPLRKFVKECWLKCGCSMQCGNRVVQRGISCKLQVFFTNNGKGWGIRSTEDLPEGAFVCEYVGEIMTNMELDKRNQEMKVSDQALTTVHKDTYPVLLDGDWCSERGLQDDEALCLDATNYGNVARFINHRCVDANLIDIPVTIESQDRHYYHVAFFTSREVRAWEELTWDYKIDFEDDDHPIEAFQCLCESEYCRGKRKGGSKKHKK